MINSINSAPWELRKTVLNWSKKQYFHWNYPHLALACSKNPTLKNSIKEYIHNYLQQQGKGLKPNTTLYKRAYHASKTPIFRAINTKITQLAKKASQSVATFIANNSIVQPYFDTSRLYKAIPVKIREQICLAECTSVHRKLLSLKKQLESAPIESPNYSELLQEYRSAYVSLSSLYYSAPESVKKKLNINLNILDTFYKNKKYDHGTLCAEGKLAKIKATLLEISTNPHTTPRTPRRRALNQECNNFRKSLKAYRTIKVDGKNTEELRNLMKQMEEKCNSKRLSPSFLETASAIFTCI